MLSETAPWLTADISPSFPLSITSFLIAIRLRRYEFYANFLCLFRGFVLSFLYLLNDAFRKGNSSAAYAHDVEITREAPNYSRK